MPLGGNKSALAAPQAFSAACSDAQAQAYLYLYTSLQQQQPTPEFISCPQGHVCSNVIHHACHDGGCQSRLLPRPQGDEQLGRICTRT